MSLIRTHKVLLWFYPTGKDLQSAISAGETWFTLNTNRVYFLITGRGGGYTPCGKTNMERVCL